MSVYIAVFLVGYFKIAARAFQQKNVTGDKWRSVIPTSYIMGFLEMATIGLGALKAVDEDWLGLGVVTFVYSTGGWLGCLSAMWLHNRLHKD